MELYFIRFGFRMWELLIFQVISAAKNSNKFQKNQDFWKEKSVEDMVTLGPKAQATLTSKA